MGIWNAITSFFKPAIGAPASWDGAPYRKIHNFQPGRDYVVRFTHSGAPVRLRLSYAAGDRGNARFSVSAGRAGFPPQHVAGPAKVVSHSFRGLDAGSDYDVTIAVDRPTAAWLQINA